MAESVRGGAPSRAKILLAFAAVYVIWGSTYLAIRYAIETLPPFLMASARFLLAGGVLYWYARARGAPRPTGQQWRATGLIGALLLLGGNGGVVWSEQHIASGLAALLVALEPGWVVLIDWLRPRGVRPRPGVFAGLVLGLVGVAVLVGPGDIVGGGSVDLLPAVVIVLAALSWAGGSVYGRFAKLPSSPLVTTGMEMLVGGALLGAAGLAAGETRGFHVAQVSATSLLALLYLLVFGSLVAFTAYIWLLRVVSPTRAATYAFVNPVVAVILGWAMAGEELSARVIVAAAVIVGAVALIITSQARGDALQRVDADSGAEGAGDRQGAADAA